MGIQILAAYWSENSHVRRTTVNVRKNTLLLGGLVGAAIIAVLEGTMKESVFVWFVVVAGITPGISAFIRGFVLGRLGVSGACTVDTLL